MLQTQRTILGLGWEVVPHAANSPDLLPTDFHFFKRLQDTLAEQRFSNVFDLNKFIDNFIASKTAAFFRDGIRELPDRWKKVIDNNGKYFL